MPNRLLAPLSALLLGSALTGCASPLGAPVSPSASRPSAELPNRALLPAIGAGSPRSAPGPAPAPTPVPTGAAPGPTPIASAPRQAAGGYPGFSFCAHRPDFKTAVPECQKPEREFEAGATRVNGVWSVTNWPGATLSGRWYLNGQALNDRPGTRTRSLCWDGRPEALGFTRSGPQFISLQASSFGTTALAGGAYRFELYVDGKLFLGEGFIVGPEKGIDPNLLAAPPTGGVLKPCGG